MDSLDRSVDKLDAKAAEAASRRLSAHQFAHIVRRLLQSGAADEMILDTDATVSVVDVDIDRPGKGRYAVTARLSQGQCFNLTVEDVTDEYDRLIETPRSAGRDPVYESMMREAEAASREP